MILEADGMVDGKWTYAFIYEVEDVPEYLKTHAKRNREASSLDEEKKLSRIAIDHIVEDVEGEWRELE